MAVSRQKTDLFSTGLLKVVERAKRDPDVRFRSLACHVDRWALQRAYRRLRKGAAVGVDGITKEAYGAELHDNLGDLHDRLREGRWRHQPIRRVHIPKGKDKTRPIGISCVADKVVQSAVSEVLEAVYEPLFYRHSYGFRPGRGAHDAVRTLNQVLYSGSGNWILEADIKSFFDSIDRKMLLAMLQNRVADGSLLRLIGKCLHVGILDGDEYSEPSEGTVQGSTLSPLLGNIYLHYVLDEWFERDVRPRLRGRAELVRYADDFVIAFERQDDAERVYAVLGLRFERYGLELHPDKTRLFPFRRPRSPNGKGPGTFDFLGFTFYWGVARTGSRVPRVKTRKASLRRALQSVAEWCRRYRHHPVKEQHAALCRRVEGHLNYFGVNGNSRAMRQLVRGVERAWKRWLSRRSQRSILNWARMNDLLAANPLPKVYIRVQIWPS
ncbi:MAG: RNA-directed DNA polymerase [Myxococcota bacterium]|jgi:RNA-directed DNA polymerase